ncbi:MAG: sialate O-acetylesterase [Fimbriimonadaceae bacterium]|nr:sialate O-acetylesterase [Fimbriimonadaceae bacterium]
MKHTVLIVASLLLVPAAASAGPRQSDTKTVRVFIFAGQSNMVGSDSKVKDIQRFPPFVGLDKPQDKVLFSYNIGREQKRTSNGWVALQPVDEVVGPELSFARKVSQETKAPIAIIKCASGGTTLGADWNPDDPSGYKLYPLALQLVRSSLAELDRRKVAYRIEGFMWHQGENDMFDQEFKPNYGKNLKNFLAKWRRDLHTPSLRFYIGELCTKTVWGMDNRENMDAIRVGQKAVTDSDPLAEYIPTSHDAVEIGGGAGLHYHYGTLGQLEHGVNYADAYLRTIGKKPAPERTLKTLPYAKGSPVKLFILAGHRNMEGERAFVQELPGLPGGAALAKANDKIAFRYSIGGRYKTSPGWVPLKPAGFYDTFGPELSFGRTLQAGGIGNIAIAKFTHSGSQMNDWTPQGTTTPDRNLYPKFIAFVRESIRELEAKGHPVELAGIFYHVGENDMSFGAYRRDAAKWLKATVEGSRRDLGLPSLKWFVSQQPPIDEKGLNAIDVTADLDALAAADPAFIHLKAFDLPPQPEQLVVTTPGIVQLGELLARSYLDRRPEPLGTGIAQRSPGVREGTSTPEYGRWLLPPHNLPDRGGDWIWQFVPRDGPRVIVDLKIRQNRFLSGPV